MILSWGIRKSFEIVETPKGQDCTFECPTTDTTGAFIKCVFISTGNIDLECKVMGNINVVVNCVDSSKYIFVFLT